VKQIQQHSALVSMLTEEEWTSKQKHWSTAVATDFKGKGCIPVTKNTDPLKLFDLK
jgi:hypothetical protein